MAYGLRQVATRRALGLHLTVDPAHTSFVRECHHPHHTDDTQPRPRRRTRRHRRPLRHSAVRRGARRVALCVRRGVRTWRAGVSASARLHLLRRLQRWTASASLACGGMRAWCACVVGLRTQRRTHANTRIHTCVRARVPVRCERFNEWGDQATAAATVRHAALAPAPQHTIIMPPCPMPNGRRTGRRPASSARSDSGGQAAKPVTSNEIATTRRIRLHGEAKR